jgi:hypothetical protein
MLTMIMNEQQTMPYYLSDEIASKPYNPNWDNLLLIGLNSKIKVWLYLTVHKIINNVVDKI